MAVIPKKDIKLLLLLFLLVFIFSYGYKTYWVIGDSMAPSNKNLEVVLVDRLHYKFEKPQQGDVIVFYDFHEDDLMIKRVIGLPGDMIQIIDGFIYKNGFLYLDGFAHIRICDYSSHYPEELGEGEYWVIGDNRDDTWWGVVYENEIIGKIKD